MTPMQHLISEFEVLDQNINEVLFDNYYERIRKNIFVNLLDNATNNLNCVDNENVMKTIQEYGRVKLHNKDITVLDTIKTILDGSNRLKLMLVDVGLLHFDCFVIVSFDKPLINPNTNKECDGLFVCTKDKLRDDEDDIITGFIVLSNMNKGFKDENKIHIINHEICHMILEYMKFKDLFSDKFKENWSYEREEFLCDFLPFYHLKDKDYLCNFLEFGQKWFKEDVLEKYREYIKEIVLYLNNQEIMDYDI